MSDHDTATEVAEEVVAAFSKLYSKLMLPYDAWRTLIEMITVECLFHYADGKLSASDITTNSLYIADAESSGLRVK